MLSSLVHLCYRLVELQVLLQAGQPVFLAFCCNQGNRQLLRLLMILELAVHQSFHTQLHILKSYTQHLFSISFTWFVQQTTFNDFSRTNYIFLRTNITVLLSWILPTPRVYIRLCKHGKRFLLLKHHITWSSSSWIHGCYCSSIGISCIMGGWRNTSCSCTNKRNDNN